MAYRDRYLSLDPAYRDAFGQPLLRIAFDWHENEFKMTQFTVGKAQKISEAMGGTVENNAKKSGSHYDTRFYQRTNTTDGTIMGTDPASSVVNRYLQCWDVHNVFVTGASAFPQNFGYNPSGLMGAQTYWAAEYIRLSLWYKTACCKCLKHLF